jgi:hypothetical protein
MNKPGSKSRILFFAVSLLIMGSFVFATYGCRILKKDKQSEALKKQEDADKAATAEYAKAKKEYYDNQSKETKKMMKRTQKRAAKFNKPMQRKGLNKTKCD